MKFGKKLLAEQDIPLFRGQYVSYTTMKQLIKDIRQAESKSFKTEVLATELWWFDSTQKTSLGSTCAERISFVRAVEDEIDKTQHHYLAQVKTVKHMIADIYTRLNTKFRLDNIFSDIDSISAELLILERYIWHAKQLILKITKKHDKMTYYKVNSWMLIRLERADFWNAKLDELVIGVSDAYTAARALQSNKDSMTIESRQVGGNENFVRKNEKYFVKPEDVMLVKLLISKHVPLDIFGRKMKKGKPLNIESLSGLQDASVINSIYLDNKSKSMYHERTGIAGPKGNLIRIRWYGSHANPCSECWMERKTRQVITNEQEADYVKDEAVKQRFRINSRNVSAYMQDDWHMEKKLNSMIAKKQIKEKDAGAMLSCANSIQEEIVSKQLGSALRTVVRRSAFQEGADQSLRFSLDMNLHIINEDVPPEEGKWARNLDAPLKLSEVKTLPYAVLEIKTQKQAPEWVRDLKSSGYVIPSDHFSKFLYGTAKLSPTEVRFTPTWWERVLELEQTTPISPPLILCPLLGKIPASSKFRANMHDILEQRAVEEDARAAARAQKAEKKEKKRDAVQVNTMHTPRASIEMEKINTANTRTSPTKDKKGANPDATVVQITSADEPAPDSGKFNIRMAFGNLTRRPEKEVKSTKPMTNKQRAVEQRTAKTFFANERTMLSWLNHSTFMALAGITLISSGAGAMAQAGGIALVLVTILFAAYALIMYLVRLYGLKSNRKGAGLDDKYGPPVLVAVFVGVMIFLAVYNIQNLTFVAQKYTVNFNTGSTGTAAL